MTFEKIREIICNQFEVEQTSVTLETTFLGDLGADSLDVVELAMNIEDEFGLDEISEEDIRGIQTVGDLVDYVNGALDD